MCSHLPYASGMDGSKAAQYSRGIVKARRAHTGLRKLLTRGGVWEVVKGKGKAVTAPPAWVWEGLAAHAPESAELACRAADASSAARYFEVASAYAVLAMLNRIAYSTLSKTSKRSSQALIYIARSSHLVKQEGAIQLLQDQGK